MSGTILRFTVVILSNSKGILLAPAVDVGTPLSWMGSWPGSLFINVTSFSCKSSTFTWFLLASVHSIHHQYVHQSWNMLGQDGLLRCVHTFILPEWLCTLFVNGILLQDFLQIHLPLSIRFAYSTPFLFSVCFIWFSLHAAKGGVVSSWPSTYINSLVSAEPLLIGICAMTFRTACMPGL